jgi:hypothetical protein
LKISHEDFCAGFIPALLKNAVAICRSPSDNLSQNPGCEAFSHVWDEGHEEIKMNDYI